MYHHIIAWTWPGLLMLSLLAMPAAPSIGQTTDVWFGTVTPKNGLSKGIYHANMNLKTGKLSTPTLAFGMSGPGFLELHPNGKVLYAVGTIGGDPMLVALNIKRDGDEVSLEMANASLIGDGGAAHVCLDRTGKVAFTAQYGGGSTAMFELNDDGTIKRRAKLEKHSGGSGVVPGRQEKPHAHWVGTSPDNRFLFVPDLGMDQVVIWKLNLDDIDFSEHSYADCPPGGGPRHMKFHPNGKFAYVLNELALSVTVFDYDAKAGKLTEIETVAALTPKEKESENTNSASEIRIHPSGKFLYTANRGHDTITVFSIDQNSGKIKVIQNEPVRGSWPRNFNIAPGGKWLVAAGRDSNTAAVFAIDQEDGTLRFNQESAMVPSPICVVFESDSQGNDLADDGEDEAEADDDNDADDKADKADK